MTPPEAVEAESPMLELLTGFIGELRSAGLPVSLTENLDAMEAITHIPIEDRDAFKWALAATLVKNNAHWRAFETVFEVYFSLRGSQYALGLDADELADLDDDDQAKETLHILLKYQTDIAKATKELSVPEPAKKS